MVCKMGCASARTGTHAGIATVPRTVATLAGCPVRVSQYYRTKKARQKALLSLLERITRLTRCTSARTGTHAGTATVPRTVATLAGCPVRVSQYYRTKKARQKALLSLLERITRLTRCTSARTGTHAGTATVPRTVATLAGCPVRVSRKDTTNKKAQGEMPCAFCWSGLRDSNSLPPPWQGGALPDELNPQTIVLLYPAGAGLSSPFFADGNKKCRPLVGITIGTTTYR